jgi:DNA-binding Lrp family transcriptional regulator
MTKKSGVCEFAAVKPIGDADFSSLMKMIYRKLAKTASLHVTCHPQTLSEIAAKVGIATPNAHRRIKRLQEQS